MASCCGGDRSVLARALVDRLPAGPVAGAVDPERPRHPTSPAAPHLAMERPEGGRPTAARADLLVLGPVATGVPGAAPAEAMAVRDGRVLAVGTMADLADLRATDTEVLDAGDGAVIPGLIEPHMHLWSTGVFYGWLDCSAEANPTFDAVVDRIRAAVAAAAPGSWVCGQLFDPSRYPGEPTLDAAILDQISTEVPIVVTNASMHFAYVSSTVFERVGITADTPDPPSGRFYRRDGKLTGVVGELNGMMAILGHLPQKSTDELASSLRAIMSEAASRGVTSMREALTGELQGAGEIALLQQMNAAQQLPTRLSLAQSGMHGAAFWSDAGIVPGGGDAMIRTDAWKLMIDGSTQGRSAYLRTDYLGGMGGNGAANFEIDELVALVRAGHDAGWQVMIHANGDAGIDRALTAYEAVLAGASAIDRRHRLEHIAVGRDEHFARMHRAGISPSFLNAHIYYWGAALRDSILGPDRAALLQRLGTAQRMGLRASLHSDYNVSPIHPLLAARIAVQRRTQADGEVLGPDDRVAPHDALRAITLDAAWQIFGDDRGTLEVGKLADFAVVSANPWTADPDDWADITVSQTRLGGTVAWEG